MFKSIFKNILLLSVSLMLIACGKANSKTSIYIDQTIKGPVKTSTLYVWSDANNESHSNLVVKRFSRDKELLSFDIKDQDHLINIERKYTYEYDEDLYLLSATINVLNNGEPEDSQLTFTYPDEETILAKELVRRGDETTLRTTKYLMQDGLEMSSRSQEMSSTSLDSEVVRLTYRYDENKNMISEVFTEDDYISGMALEYTEFDKYGNWLGAQVKHFDKYGTSDEATPIKRELEYFSD